ncbi:MAG: hypothetical protein KAS26_03075 [Sulfurimonas sp.]|nr:hypothetical protein [Sulfurimonas sp.]
MKKIILLLLMVFSLNASQVMCDDSWDRYMKHYRLFEFAKERNDVNGMKNSTAMAIMYVERTIVECGDDWKHKESAEGIRKALLKIDAVLGKY